MNNHIISSLLYTDRYKFTMMQGILHQFPATTAKFRFKCRNKVDLLPIIDDINHQLDCLCFLRFHENELSHLGKSRYIKKDFIDFLRIFKLQRDAVKVGERNGELDIVIEGSWLHVILFEIYILAIVQELYTTYKYSKKEIAELYEEGRRRLANKINVIKGYEEITGQKILMFDFGTRRAFNHFWYEYVVKTLAENNIISGTSNDYMAMKYDLTPIGTFAHEWVQAFQGLGICQLKDSQSMAFQKWAEEYRGDLGIALSDTLGTTKFLKDFDMYFAKLFDGCRHDSGDPFVWGDTIIKHYENMKIDPRTKMLVFSDGLDIPKLIELHKYFLNRIKVSFGVGTNLTNDLGVDALQIVIKMIMCNGNHVAKLSNNPGKMMCENEPFVNYLREVIL